MVENKKSIINYYGVSFFHPLWIVLSLVGGFLGGLVFALFFGGFL